METQDCTNTDTIPIIPIGMRTQVLPSIVTRLVLGCREIDNWHGNKEAVALDDVYGSTILNRADFTLAKEIAQKIAKEFSLQRMIQPHQILMIRDRAQDVVESLKDSRAGKYGVIMLRDQGGCGYWRMVMPSRYMDKSDMFLDITGGAAGFEYLMKYDTICVQRVHNWDSHAVIERLKAAGKRVIYDIDDDIFSITEDNPAFRSYGRSEQMAAVECMKIADVVTVTTDVLQDRISSMAVGSNPIVVPNSLDPDDTWVPTPATGSPDEWKRIFWQGSNTHDGDWESCFDAVDHIMARRDNVRIVILGHLPRLVQERLGEPHWKGRVEFVDSLDPDAYFRLIKHVRADVGLAPLLPNNFNRSKSCIKWMENTMIGMPTVASDICTYSDVIEHGVNGFLCSNTEEWVNCIETCLDNPHVRLSMINNSRKKVRDEYDIKDTVNLWKQILTGKES